MLTPRPSFHLTLGLLSRLDTSCHCFRYRSLGFRSCPSSYRTIAPGCLAYYLFIFVYSTDCYSLWAIKCFCHPRRQTFYYGGWSDCLPLLLCHRPVFIGCLSGGFLTLSCRRSCSYHFWENDLRSFKPFWSARSLDYIVVVGTLLSMRHFESGVCS